MHVRIAWEIYHHQAKQNPDKANGPKPGEMLRPPSHVYPPTAGLIRPHDLPSSAYPPSGLSGRPPFEATPLPASFLNTPSSHLGELCDFLFDFCNQVNFNSILNYRFWSITIWTLWFSIY